MEEWSNGALPISRVTATPFSGKMSSNLFTWKTKPEVIFAHAHRNYPLPPPPSPSRNLQKTRHFGHRKKEKL